MVKDLECPTSFKGIVHERGSIRERKVNYRDRVGIRVEAFVGGNVERVMSFEDVAHVGDAGHIIKYVVVENMRKRGN